MIYNYTNKEDQKEKVVSYLIKNNYKRVLDVGGTCNPWCFKHVTHYLDINTATVAEAVSFTGDINDPDGWKEVEEDVMKHGKFDFIICTHTLEDIRNPQYVLKQLSRVGKEGFISAPSMDWELGQRTELMNAQDLKDWGVTSTGIGFFHHRWVLSVYDNTLWLFPKIGILNFMELGWVKGRDGAFHEQSFWWKDTIEFKTFNNDYLGPNGVFICDLYRKQLALCGASCGVQETQKVEEEDVMAYYVCKTCGRGIRAQKQPLFCYADGAPFIEKIGDNDIGKMGLFTFGDKFRDCGSFIAEFGGDVRLDVFTGDVIESDESFCKLHDFQNHIMSLVEGK